MLHLTQNYFIRLQILFFVVLLLLLVPATQAEEYAATLHWHNKTSLSFRVSGMVSTVAVKVGDIVNKKALLMKLDNWEFINNKSAKKAIQTLRKSQLEEAKREMRRSTELYDQTVLSEHEYQLKKNSLIEAKSLFQSAKADYLNANRELEYSVLYAPMKALVLDINAYNKKTIISRYTAETVITLADATHMRARTRVDYHQLKKLKRGDTIKVMLNNRTINGMLTFSSLLMVNITTSLQENTRKYLIDIVLPVKSSELRAGLSAMVVLP